METTTLLIDAHPVPLQYIIRVDIAVYTKALNDSITVSTYNICLHYIYTKYSQFVSIGKIKFNNLHIMKINPMHYR